ASTGSAADSCSIVISLTWRLHDQQIRRLLDTPLFGNGQRQTPDVYLNPYRVVDGNGINKIDTPPSGGRWHYPQSHFIRQVLRDPFRLVEPDDHAYGNAFNRFEFLTSLIAMDQEDDFLANPWPGEFLLDPNWGYADNSLAADAEREMTPAWPLLQSGAFGGDLERGKKALQALIEYRAKHPRW
ncbi:hypothetical protein PV364_41065, partial [Streptomyces sp. MI02-7b]|nr:hypothetical protein [Streptomyces sp. MI02-7b]